MAPKHYPNSLRCKRNLKLHHHFFQTEIGVVLIKKKNKTDCFQTLMLQLKSYPVLGQSLRNASCTQKIASNKSTSLPLQPQSNQTSSYQLHSQLLTVQCPVPEKTPLFTKNSSILVGISKRRQATVFCISCCWQQ